jgi:hypothetical protein
MPPKDAKGAKGKDAKGAKGKDAKGAKGGVQPTGTVLVCVLLCVRPCMYMQG